MAPTAVAATTLVAARMPATVAAWTRGYTVAGTSTLTDPLRAAGAAVLPLTAPAHTHTTTVLTQTDVTPAGEIQAARRLRVGIRTIRTLSPRPETLVKRSG